MSSRDFVLLWLGALGGLFAYVIVGSVEIVLSDPETPVNVRRDGERVEWRTAPDEYMRLVVGGIVRMTVDDQMRVTCHGVGGRSLEVIDGKAVCHVK